MLITLQLLNLLLLTQNWYSISMAPNGQSVTLGDYTGADANPSAMASTSFALVAILVVGFTAGLARLIAIILALLADVALTVFVGMAIVHQNISALDSTLDRLTGIAQTHGISGLTISQSWLAIAWLIVQVLLDLSLVASAIWQRRWSSTRAAKTTSKDAPAAAKRKPRKPASTIDLWDDQRR